MSIEILKAGLQTTVQSSPRLGHRHWGVPWAGAADELSYALANRCVGNRPGSAALEIAYGQFSVRFEEPALISLTGAPASATLNSTPLSFDKPVNTPPGSILTLAMPSVGVRTYLAVAGGIAAETFMGSASTYRPAGLGGHHGRELKDGDRLEVLHRQDQADAVAIPPDLQVVLSDQWRLRLHSGRMAARMGEIRKHLYKDTFVATLRSDRMGIQIEGPSLEIVEDAVMDSVPVFPGTVQLPPDGKPFILMRDAQTTGGYPRLGQVARIDRHKLGQIRPGDQIRFMEVSPDSARRALFTKEEMLKRIDLHDTLF
ncbi:MAG: biotin-dependent carboxyltransferase family protein [Pseudomonadota bacterium]